MRIQPNDFRNPLPGTVLLHAPAIAKRVRALGAEITSDYAGKQPLVVGVLKGASIFHSDLVRAIALDVTCDFIAVESYGTATSTSGEIRLLKDLDRSLAGNDVLLVEDIVDTGLTLDFLLRHLGTRAPKSLKTAVLLDKKARRRIEVPIDYAGFDVPDAFIVGYGLDCAGRYRNLPDIRVVGARDA